MNGFLHQIIQLLQERNGVPHLHALSTSVETHALYIGDDRSRGNSCSVIQRLVSFQYSLFPGEGTQLSISPRWTGNSSRTGTRVGSSRAPRSPTQWPVSLGPPEPSANLNEMQARGAGKADVSLMNIQQAVYDNSLVTGWKLYMPRVPIWFQLASCLLISPSPAFQPPGGTPVPGPTSEPQPEPMQGPLLGMSFFSFLPFPL